MSERRGGGRKVVTWAVVGALVTAGMALSWGRSGRRAPTGSGDHREKGAAVQPAPSGPARRETAPIAQPVFEGQASPSRAPALPRHVEPPEPESEHPSPQRNDPIRPELPQTPEWRHAKLARAALREGEQAARLESQLEEARSRGNAAEVHRLTVLARRYRQRTTAIEAQRDEPLDGAGGSPSPAP